MTDIRTGFVFAASILLAGCATANIQPSDLSALGSAPTTDDIAKIAHGSPLYRLDYLAGGHSFIYETYEQSDTVAYYGLLFQDGKLAAADVIPEKSAYWSDLRHCTVFPPDAGRDVEKCFQAFDQATQAHAVNLGSGVAPAQAAKSPSAGQAAGAVIEGTVYVAMSAPILIPVAAIALPVLGALALEDQSRRESLHVTLGESYADLRSRVETYPAKFTSITDGDGTVLIPGVGPSEVAGAFGVANGEVIWIDMSPRAGCGGGLFVAGTHCTMGREPQPPVFKQVPHKPRPPVIDEWENIALYYSAPSAQYDVLGEVRGRPQGFTSKGRMEEAIEEMKRSALKDGATALLVDKQGYMPDQDPTAAPAAGTGMPVYGADATVSFSGGLAHALEIYVPTDAEAFLKAAPLHATTCDALSQKKDDAKDAYKAVKGTGTPAEIAAAQQTLQAAEDAKDAAYCGDDDWYAELMAAQKH